MPAAKLSKEMKTFVVMALATWETPTAVQRELKEQFNADVSLPAILHYDGSRAGCPKVWKELFDKTRERFLDDVAAIPIANRAFRLKELNRLLTAQLARPINARNPNDIRATLEQAAKEAGNAFSNVRELTGKGGKPLMPDRPDVVVYLPDNGRGDATPTPALDPEN